MKKVLRLIVKIISTPIYIPLLILVALTGLLMSGWLWTFDKFDDFKMNNAILVDVKNDIVKWFTTI